MELRDEDFENLVPEDPPILLPPGLYPARVLRQDAEQFRSSSGPYEKIVLTCQIFTRPDLTDNVALNAYYSFERGGGGRFHFGKRCNYRRDWIAANDGRLPSRRTSLPRTAWEGLKIVEVVTVTRDGDGKALHPSNYYSKIYRFIRPVEDGETFPTLPLQPPGNTYESHS